MSLIQYCSIVGSRLDYCNALLYGSTDTVLYSLQRVRNNLARTVFRSCLSNWHELHWLSIREHIISGRLATFVFVTFLCPMLTFMSNCLAGSLRAALNGSKRHFGLFVVRLVTCVIVQCMLDSHCTLLHVRTALSYLTVSDYLSNFTCDAHP